MLAATIVACEIGFWVVLALGLVVRYGLRRQRLGAALLLLVPLVDLVLLVVTVADLRRGGAADWTHGLAAVYLGVSVGFGHSMVRWADARMAHWLADGPEPPDVPESGTPERVRKEWQDFGRACVAGAVSAVLLVGAAALAEDGDALLGWLPRIGVVLLVWLLGWPVWETHKLRTQPVSARGPRQRR
ncbi:hypothetical protein [Motilibacter aurantiacus]|uniref:hypothetical protein n=1 Tax=Motilibacter aurantiacus TaxID=2714955 RepID=UPI00140809E8|nr:hypothetical protein [Motilibacter aurantiacus]NHC47171.1 hypothetical protein [Motilibacter aurantiacus]